MQHAHAGSSILKLSAPQSTAAAWCMHVMAASVLESWGIILYSVSSHLLMCFPINHVPVDVLACTLDWCCPSPAWGVMHSTRLVC